MIIKKFTGKTEGAARNAAKAELGENAVIMNVKTIKPTGFFRIFKSPIVEITAAIEEVKENPSKSYYELAKEKNEAETGTEENKASEIPPVYSKPVARVSQPLETPTSVDNDLGLRLDKLQQLLEDRFEDEDKKKAEEKDPEMVNTLDLSASDDGNAELIKRIEDKLIENEVDPAYAASILEEVQRNLPKNAGIDAVLSAVYQRMILKFGKAEGIGRELNKTKVVFFIGPTGVGKTTTIAKIASHYRVELGKSVALLTADTYRIAATDQLRVYADILGSPLSIVYSADELNRAVSEMSQSELILVDTAGFSHRNMPQKSEMQELLQSLDERFDKEIYLVVSATTKYKDLKEIVDAYKDFGDYKLIFTKLDETTAYGNLLNIRMYTGASMSYSTNGQNVPDDIELFQAQRMVKQLLGGK